jgi:hypothetical protein
MRSMLALAAAAALLGGADEEALFEWSRGFEPAPGTAVDASAVPAGASLRLRTFHRQDWPGLTLKAPAGHWDLSKRSHISVDVANAGKTPATINLRVDSGESDGTLNCNTGSVALAAGGRGTIVVEFVRRLPAPDGVALFGMNGYPGGRHRAIDPAQVTQLILFVARPREDHEFEIGPIRAAGSYVAPRDATPADAKSFFPFIDEFGQYVHRDWPGKTKSVEELRRRAASESDELTKAPGPRGWDRFGGWADGPALEATGQFRTAKHAGRWWLVDPDGKLFFSHGVDCVEPRGSTPVEERDGWFRAWPAPGAADFKPFFQPAHQVLHGHYAGRHPLSFDITGANLFRKYGADWGARSSDVAQRRLRSWGFNTIGNWSDEATCLAKRTPYVVAIHFAGKELEGSEGYWGRFRDVFDPDFAALLKSALNWQVGRSSEDPWCIGYFVDNELSWGDETSLAIATLRSPAGQTAKKSFLDDLKAKYGKIERLNGAWGSAHASWEALLAHREPPDAAKAGEDLRAFNARTAELYFRSCRDAVKAVSPKRLYLGCRFAEVNPQVAEIAAKLADVVSFNIYQRPPEAFSFPLKADVPLLIGEFHFGALDRGPFHPGLVLAKDQEERARFYRDYLRAALRHPGLVGCHWFQYRDQPTTGRDLDGENYQIGFVDIADTPYPEIIAASRGIGDELYGGKR